MDAHDEETPPIRRLPPQDECSEFTSDGGRLITNQRALKQSTGNWRACFFYFSECVAFYAISKNLVTYLTGVIHESNVDAATTVSTWIGTSFLTPLIGAFLADTFLGRYWTVLVFLSVYTTGMATVTASAFLPLLMGSSYDHGVHRAVAYLGLYLVALGNGGIKPCVSALGADQFDAADRVERVAKGSYFNWYYFSVNIGSLLSATVVVWVQDNIGWGLGFAIPTVLMVLGLAVFVAGRKVYRYQKVGGSPITRVFQVVVAAVRKYHLALPEDCSALLLHEHHTSQFRFLDKAAIVEASSGDGEKGATTSPWRLCTVSQVEDVKMLLRMFPVWVSMVLFFAATAQMSSTLIEQGAAMDNHVGPFTVPTASLAIFEILSVMVCIPIYDAVLVPLARRATGKERGLSQLQRLGVGLALSVVGMAYAALAEARRLALARSAPAENGRPSMSIMWQAPAFAVLGAGEVFSAIGILEFFYDQSPDGMKSLGTALAQLTVAAGNYLNSAVLAAVAAVTARGGKPGWIPDDLDEGHLDYFFWLMAVLGLVNLLHFLHCSVRYRGRNSNNKCS
ncbi:hypothetical protein U9M48_003658 [Paspalum notatum var. saurae]|uniref:Uncharacterized protein n=1 Tax=Paspalum notatum var. saurae TaxID=547442 RepID=A0AAQ3PIR9_PASNO